MKYEEAIYTFIILMIVIFIIDYFIINKRRLNLINNNGKTKKGKKKKVKSISEIDYLINKFKLDDKKLNKENIIIWLNLFVI